MSCILKYRDVSTSLQCFNEATPCKWCITCISMQCTYLHIYADIKEFIRRTKTKLKDSRKKRHEVVKRKYPYLMLTDVILRGYNQYEMNVLNLNWERKYFKIPIIFLVINIYVALILDSSDSSLYFFAMYCTYGINI